jgi:hypothetical protein
MERGQERGRSRTVTFRVSAAEFESMVRAGHAANARSLSAFARAAVLDQVRAIQTPAVTLSGDLTTLTRSLADLDTSLHEASRRIRRVLGSGATSSAEWPQGYESNAG